MKFLIYPLQSLDKQSTKKLKNQKAKITKSLFMKDSRNNNIILSFSIWFYVLGLS